jgi:hypothetical protein
MDTKPQGTPIVPPDRDRSERLRVGWDACDFCGAKHIQVDLKFTSGSVEPTEDEVITGASSGSTCVFVEVVLLSGSWAGGDAAGWMKCSTPSAWDGDTQRWGTADEILNGATAGNNFATLDDLGEIKKYGHLHPKSELTDRDGKRLCIAHYNWYFGPRDRDAEIIEIREEDRGQEW